jgi:hypothetical protein
MKKTVDIPVQVRVAALQSIDGEKRTAEMVWSTGAQVRRYDWFRDEVFIEELSMDPAHVRMTRLNGGAPVLDTHNQWSTDSVIGIVEKAWINGSEGRASVRFAEGDERVDRIWNKVKQGILRNVSVGYAIHSMEDVTEKGAKMRTMRATDWEPMEVSIVPVGADGKAGIRADGGTHPCEIEFAERSAETPDDPTAGQAAPPANRGGVSLLLRVQEQVERENQ